MRRKKILGLILFGFLISGGLFVSVNYMMDQGVKGGIEENQTDFTKDDASRKNIQKNADIEEPRLAVNSSTSEKKPEVNSSPETAGKEGA
ncbi:MAG TPA: hypothetical protein DHW85_01340, partial [Lachnospiraceae bacterium]|nr:hypothetical protein [Lachnospiraceae bacterium]